LNGGSGKIMSEPEIKGHPGKDNDKTLNFIS
jgi:hypothetical protein